MDTKMLLQEQVKAYKQKLAEYENEIKKKEAEYEAERVKTPKLRKRKLSEIKDEIQQLRTELFRSKPKRKCANCGQEIDYDDILCWKCGEVFLDVCPRCKSLSVSVSKWGLCKCAECNSEYRDLGILEDLLIGTAEPSYRYFTVVNPRDISSFNCYNVGIRKSTIWDMCKEYNCPFDEKCEYYCPAFLALLALIKRGKVSVGLPWGEYRGGDVHGYEIRWKRSRWSK